MTRTRVDICKMALGRIGENHLISDLDEVSAAAEACKINYEECLRQVLERYPWPFARKQVTINRAFYEYDESTSYSEDDKVLYDSILYISLSDSNLGNEITNATYWQEVGPFSFGWEYAYVLPDDCITPIILLTDGERIGNLLVDDRPAFEICMNYDNTGKLLLCDLEEDFCLEYIAFPGTDSSGEWLDSAQIYPSAFVEALTWLLASKLALDLKKDQTMCDRFEQRFEMSVSRAIAQSMNARQGEAEIDTPSIAARGD